jgi:hypothetical protein
MKMFILLTDIIIQWWLMLMDFTYMRLFSPEIILTTKEKRKHTNRGIIHLFRGMTRHHAFTRKI